MQTDHLTYDLKTKQWSGPFPALNSPRTLVLGFGDPAFIDDPDAFRALHGAFPDSIVAGCSASGEIIGRSLADEVLAVTVTRFDHTGVQAASVVCTEASFSYGAGEELGRKLKAPSLRAVFILSDGLRVNGAELVRGLKSMLGENVIVTGGLAGDGERFERTWVGLGDTVGSGLVVAVGFCGDQLVVSHSSKGGWETLGPRHLVTKAKDNVIYELDDRPALAVYKEALGAQPSMLLEAARRHPLTLRSTSDDQHPVVRTLLAVDEEQQSMTFEGEVSMGQLVQVMRSDLERLIGGAATAAASAREQAGIEAQDTLAVAVSGAGRRRALGSRTVEEIEALAQELPAGATVTGFYSYGELSPVTDGSDLQHETMSLTTFSESSPSLPRVPDLGEEKEASTSLPTAASDLPTELLRFAEGSNGVTQRADQNSEAMRAPTTSDSQHFSENVAALNRSTSSRADQSSEALVMTSAPQLLAEGVEVVSGSTSLLAAEISQSMNASATASESMEAESRLAEQQNSASANTSTPATRSAAGEALDEQSAAQIASTPTLENPVMNIKLPSEKASEPTLTSASLDATKDGQLPGIDLTFDGRTHRVTVRHTIDEMLSWPFDALQGELIIDLSLTGGATSTGAQRLIEALTQLDTRVEAVRIEGAPQALLETLGKALPLPGVTVVSAILHADCSMCLLSRPALVDLAEAAHALTGVWPLLAPCPHCHTELDLSFHGPTIAKVLGIRLPEAPAQSVWHRRLTSRRNQAVAGIAALAFIIFGSALMLTPSSKPESTQSALEDSQKGPASPDLPPPWTEQRFQFNADEVLIVGSGSGPSSTEALAPARLDAQLTFIRHALEPLAGTKAYELATRLEAGEDPTQTAARFERQLSDVVVFDRIDAYFSNLANGVASKVRYRVPRAQFDAAVEAYRASKHAFGLTLTQLFPTVATSGREGALLVTAVSPAAAKAGVREGDVLLTAGRRLLPTLAAVMNAAKELNGPVMLGLESKGARRDIRVIAAATPQQASGKNKRTSNE